MICIYCLQDKSLSEFQKREHVLPQCFGTFTPDNLILKEIVCDDCNQYFGDKLELYLGRDSIWGIERYRHGIKPTKKYKHQRMKFKVLEGALKGVIVSPLYSDKGEGIDLPPKKWTQRRVGDSMIASSKSGGVQWKGKKEKRSDLTKISKYQQSRWSQKAAISPQRWPGALESILTSSITGSGSLVSMGIRLFPAKGI